VVLAGLFDNLQYAIRSVERGPKKACRQSVSTAGAAAKSVFDPPSLS
jgi:hypothetical protein